jgi:membrane peptidoglycan carboxypeptidase
MKVAWHQGVGDDLSLRAAVRLSLLSAALFVAAFEAGATRLEQILGRNEVRVYSAPLVLELGDSPVESAVPERLERLGYRRVHQRPERPGEYFWGHERFWIYRREHDLGRRREAPALIHLELERSTGRISMIRSHQNGREPRRLAKSWLEPELLAESLDEERALRRGIRVESLPDHVWRAVLAIEDARFFDHPGVDSRSTARAALKNVLAGKVTQGGSTITQQLIKMRDLSPKRTLGRKASEAARALVLERQYGKNEILSAYLNSVYLGHVDGVAVHGISAAATAYYSKPVDELSLGEAALLAGMIQGPNRLSPLRHPERSLARQHVVLERMRKLDWAPLSDIERSKRSGLPPLEVTRPSPILSGQLRTWIREEVDRRAPKRAARGRGFVIKTTIDPHLQGLAVRAAAGGVDRLRTRYRQLARDSFSVALIVIDGSTGGVLAHVAGDPRRRGDAFDRVRRARRQPGSTVKPMVLLEAFENCGSRVPLHPARRVRDSPLRIEWADGEWSPRNPGGDYRAEVDLREAVVWSLNVPFVRVARWCGFEATAARFRAAGLAVPAEAPPAFVLGAVETTPLQLAGAYTIFTTLGERLEPRVVERLEKPSGRRLFRGRVRKSRVVRRSTAYLVRDLLRDTVDRGIARGARWDSRTIIGKTGTSSEWRDAWFVGAADDLVAAVWVGRDDGKPLGVDGANAALPIWRSFMRMAVTGRAPSPVRRPAGVVERWIDPETGATLRTPRNGARKELFRRDLSRRSWTYRNEMSVID